MPSPPELNFDQGTLLLGGVSQRFIERVFDDGVWVFDGRVGKFRCDALHYAAVQAALNTHLTSRWVDSVPAWKRLDHLAALAVAAEQVRDINTSPNNLEMKPSESSEVCARNQSERPVKRAEVQLRINQLRAVDAWLATRRGCLVMPTGTGKTEVALKLITSVASSTLIVAPVRDLMYQWHRRILLRTGIDAGILGDGVYRVSPLTVTTYDSAFLHMARLGNQFALIVFDECHHLPGPSRQDAARMCAAPYRLGLTATPYRSDGRQGLLEELIGPICYQQKLDEARGDTLANYDLHRIPVYLSDAERQRYDELSRTIQQYMFQRRQDDASFTWQKLCQESGRDPASRRALKAFHAKSAIEDRAEEKLRVLEDLFRLHVGEPCLIFTGTNAMARDISRRFLIPCLLSHCGKRERLDILSGLEEGRYPAVVANRVLDEGVDLPDVKVAIVIGGSSSPRQATQRLGRILRRSRFGRGVLYEVVTRQTKDVARSRQRRASMDS